MTGRRRIAVVGSGVAGLTAAYVLQNAADVTLYEADARIGGHADTHDVVGVDGQLRAIDTGFIVHNRRTYPMLVRLFEELGVSTQQSDMSMSISCAQCGLEYAGGRGLSGLLPSVRTVARPRYLRLLGEVARFYRRAHELLASDEHELTLREFLDRHGFSGYFASHFITPVIAAVWSTAPTHAGDYPARYLFTFLDNHGVLAVKGSPVWYTVTGGSARYVERAAKGLTAVRTSTPIRAVDRVADGVVIHDDADSVERYDGVVIATHPRQALRLLAAPTPEESQVLGAIGYTLNPTVLHTDGSVLPRTRRAQASWNYAMPACDALPTTVNVSYNMNRLQRLDAPETYVVTLNGEDRVRPDTVIDRMAYEHPVYTTESVAARTRLPGLNDGTVAFAGAYHGWGFHEDGCRSGVEAAASLGVAWVTAPARYDVEVVHVRSDPVRHEVRRRGQLWFVDLDDLPDHGPLARFEARDHLGDPALSLRENVDEYLAEQGIDLAGGRVTMLTDARAAGYVFNPLTLFWCHDRAGAVVAVIAEVHNTYRQRHRYLLRPDDAGRAEVVKEFYVSPFYPVDGHYRMSLPEPGERLAITITLHRPGERPFVASVRGTPCAATRRAVVGAALRHPLATWRTRAAITRHGLALWRAGLPVQPRPPHDEPHDEFHDQPLRPPRSTPMTSADRIAALARSFTGADLPVRIRSWDGSEAGPSDGPVLILRSRRALRRLLWAPGELGLARAYVAGDLDVEGDLTEGLRRAWAAPPPHHAPTPATWLRLGAGAVRLGVVGLPPAPPPGEARLSGRAHSRRRDRAAIAHHYDLSNEFYELLLDESMAYSCAIFTEEADTLPAAQRAKLDRICRKLELRPGMRFLDVGCGWGALLLHAAEHYGVHATGITLSAQQRDHVAKRIADRGLSGQVSVRLQDYRDLGSDRYDAVASIEMGEHVGDEMYPTYTAALHAALRPGGRLMLQQMSRTSARTAGGGAFIETYIAPDMHMRPLPRTLTHLEGAGFEIRDVAALREHYATTARAWLDTLEADWGRFVAGWGEETARVWRLYLVGGALAFEQGRMGVDQVLAFRQ